jgi:peptidoglycan/xylan/chitin deacetylase (PgdA/CDA1 family)
MVKQDRKRINVLLTFDVDADSSVRGPYSGRPDEPVARSKGQFGPKVGLPRILNLLDKYAVKTTFFVPGWAAETYPDSVREIVRRGHEAGVHGYRHENLAQLNSQKDEAEIFKRSIDKLEDVVGKRPVGFRAPDWEFSPYTMENLTKFNLKYDSSLMDSEEPYIVKSSGIVELPVAWSWDDWGQFEIHRRRPSVVLDAWTEEFDAVYAAGMPYFNLTMHPQTIGRASRIVILEKLIRYIRKKRCVRFLRCVDLAREVSSRHLNKNLTPEEE